MKNRPIPPCESEHEFTLVLASGVELTEQVENALYEAGCSDAIVSVRCGRVFLTFTRSAVDLKGAVLSAIRDVQRAGVGEVVRVDRCDLVTQADIARRIGRSRQAVYQYISGQRGPGGFPPPNCNITDDAPLWSWCEVASWLWMNDMLPEGDMKEARQVSAINTVLDLRFLESMSPELISEIIEAFERHNADSPCECG